MPYISPQDVSSPKRRWHQFDVLDDKGEGRPSYAIGKWDGDKVIVYRWNGTSDALGGNPQSRGYPTWIVLDPDIYDAIIPKLPEDKQQLARVYLDL